MSAPAPPQPAPRKLLIQMSGAPGSGKSTLARLLARSLQHAVVIDHDVLRSTLLGPASPSPSASTTSPTTTATASSTASPSLPFEQAAQLSYALQFSLAASFLTQGAPSIILDSTCAFQETLTQGRALAARFGCAYWYVECALQVQDLPLLDARLRGREGLRSQRTGVEGAPAAAAVGEEKEGGAGKGGGRELFESWIRNPCRPDENAIVVDAKGEPEALGDYVLKRILG